MKKLRELIEKYWDILSYIFFGGLTTVVNWLVYYPLTNVLGVDAYVSNIIAWAVSVAFAFLTNKPFVFRSHDWSASVVVPELVKFVGTRVGSGFLETALLFLFVDLMQWDGNILKIVFSVLVVIINYVGSKLLVFRKK
ncbi:MAG: GtrA family protein [Oscillospiraceae bacterium]|nr:GtrA family protein [Oscillospiraceae bacterium]